MSMFTILALLTISFFCLVNCQDRPGFQPRARNFDNRTAVLYGDEIKGADNKGRDYDLIRKKSEADLKIQGGSRFVFTM